MFASWSQCDDKVIEKKRTNCINDTVYAQRNSCDNKMKETINEDCHLRNIATVDIIRTCRKFCNNMTIDRCTTIKEIQFVSKIFEAQSIILIKLKN